MGKVTLRTYRRLLADRAQLFLYNVHRLLWWQTTHNVLIPVGGAKAQATGAAPCAAPA